MLDFNYKQLDTSTNFLTVGAGALWADIIPYLDKYNRSVYVMQTNNSFTVGGSVSANCHGWQPNTQPIASTVESFRLINANGELLTCSRYENQQLFSLVLGGYGLFGIILDLKLKTVPNELYKCKQYIINSSDYVNEFLRVTTDKNVRMAYGRININPQNFMNESIISTFVIDTNIKKEDISKTSFTKLRRTVFRSSVNSNYGKNLRWRAEKITARLISKKVFSRNQLLNESVEVFQNTDPRYTDILHEYFIPKDSVNQFIELLKTVIPKYDVDLLNITVRNVMKDESTF
ncbi:FAD-binding protein [Niabella ginsengisoli]|nr:FAD-binding protein [Niabella ginsengisoli]MCH5596420.1 FAD-binding protein [Niabella ginsengisoli]